MKIVVTCDGCGAEGEVTQGEHGREQYVCALGSESADRPSTITLDGTWELPPGWQGGLYEWRDQPGLFCQACHVERRVR